MTIYRDKTTAQREADKRARQAKSKFFVEPYQNGFIVTDHIPLPAGSRHVSNDEAAVAALIMMPVLAAYALRRR